MIEANCRLKDSWVPLLEDYCCGPEASPWVIRENRRKGVFRLAGYFPDREAAREAWIKLRRACPFLPEQPRTVPFPESQWLENYKRHFRPWSYRGLHWIPVWEKNHYPVPPGEAAVYTDPGLAFGTGAHPTTRLCARRLLDCRDRWRDSLRAKKVMDAGCGSGILALSATALGFGHAAGFDSDPQAVAASLENARLNGWRRLPVFYEADIGKGMARRKADLILANLQSGILCRHAPRLLRSLRPGGVLVLSGILGEETTMVRNRFLAAAQSLPGAFRAAGRRQDGWAELSLSHA